MSSVFSVKGTFDGQELVKGFQDVKDEVEGVKKAGASAKSTLDKMLQQKNSTTNYKRQLSQITAELTDLAVNYDALTEAEKNSEFGKAMSARIDELTSKAQSLKIIFNEVNETLKGDIELPEPDVSTWDAFADIIDVASGCLQTYAGVVGLSEENTEALMRVITKMQTIEAGANAIIKAGNMLKKSGNVITKVKIMQEKAATAAIKMKTVAETKSIAMTKAATAAQKIFNAVALANPYVLLAAAIVAAGAAIVGFIKKANDAEAANERIKESAEQMADKTGSQVIAFETLARSYRAIGDSAEAKEKFMKQYADQLKEVGINTNDINVLDKIFIENSEAFVKAINSRAMADLMQEAMVDEYKRHLERLDKLNQDYLKKQQEYEADVMEFTWAEQMTAKWQKMFPDTKELGHDTFATKGSSEAKKAADDAKYRLEQEKRNWQDQLTQMWQSITNLNQEYVDTMQNLGLGGEEIVAQQGSLTDLQNQLNTYKTSLNNMSPDSEEWNPTIKKIRSLQTEIDKLQKRVDNGIKGSVSFDINSLAYAQQKVNELRKSLEEMSPDDKRWQPTIDKLKEAQKHATELQEKINEELKITPDYETGSLDEANAELSKYQKELNKISPNSENYNIVLSKLEEWKQKVEDIKKKQQLLTADDITNMYKDAKSDIEDIIEQYETAVISEDDVKKSVENVNKILKDAELDPIIVTVTAEMDFKHNVSQRRKEIQELQDEFDLNYEAFDFGMIDETTFKSKVAAINAELAKLGADPIELELDVDDAITNLEKFRTALDVVNSFGGVVSAIDGVVQSIKNWDEAMEEAETGWDRFMVGFELSMQILNGVSAVLSVIETVTTLCSLAEKAANAEKSKGITLSAAKTTANITEAASAQALTSANVGATVTEATAAHAGIPFVGVALAAVAVAALMGLIFANINKFASGGIVQSASKVGDLNIARVNGGEMILNERQQKNLFDMIDQNRLPQNNNSTGEVVFRIQGDTLVGAIDNYNKKRGRI